MKLGELLRLSHKLLTQAEAPHALIGGPNKMTDKEYIEFVEEFLELFSDSKEKREKIQIDKSNVKL